MVVLGVDRSIHRPAGLLLAASASADAALASRVSPPSQARVAGASAGWVGRFFRAAGVRGGGNFFCTM